MNRKRTLVMGLTLALVLAIGIDVGRAEGKSSTVKGYVLDSACALTKNLSKPISADCAVACAKAGSPLVILADDGTIYWPVSDTSSLPAKGQNDRVIAFAGQKVSAQGTVYTKGGSHGIVIEKIEAIR